MKLAWLFASGGMQQIPALATQRRNVILVTRVLPAPLWLLVISILAFALAGIDLTIAAFAIGPKLKHV